MKAEVIPAGLCPYIYSTGMSHQYPRVKHKKAVLWARVTSPRSRGGLQPTVRLLETQHSGREMATEVPGVRGRELPATAGQRASPGRCPTGPAVSKRGRAGGRCVVGRYLGHSEHGMTEGLGEVRRGVSRAASVELQRASFGLFRILADRVLWEAALKGHGVQAGWTFFRKEVSKVQDQAIPMCQKTSW